MFLLLLNSTCLFLLVSYPVACWLSDASSPYDILRAKVMAEFVLSSFSLYSEDASLLSKGKQWGFSYKCKSESEWMLFMCYITSEHPFRDTNIQCWKSTDIIFSVESLPEYILAVIAQWKGLKMFFPSIRNLVEMKFESCRTVS